MPRRTISCYITRSSAIAQIARDVDDANFSVECGRPSQTDGILMNRETAIQGHSRLLLCLSTLHVNHTPPVFQVELEKDDWE